MGARATCRFCGKNVGVKTDLRLVKHGFERNEHGITRIDKSCKGSGMLASEAATEPVNVTKACQRCGMPVVIAAGAMPDDQILCPICLMPDTGDPTDV